MTLRTFSRKHLLLHTKHADCARPLPARCLARTSPPRCFRRLRGVSRVRLLLGALLRTSAMQRLLLPASRAPCAQPLLSKFPPSSPVASLGEEALRPTPLPADSCRTAGIERNGSAQKSPVCCRVQQTSPCGNSGSFDCGSRPEGTTASPEHWGRQMIRLATGSEASGCEASLRAAKTRPVPLIRYHLLEDYGLLDTTGSRHTTQPTHARERTKTRGNPDPRETAADLARVMLLLDASTIARNAGHHLLFAASRHAEHSHSDLGGCADCVADTLLALQTARLCSWHACGSVWIATSFRQRPRMHKHPNAWWSMHLHTLLLDTSKVQLTCVHGMHTHRGTAC